MFIKKYRIKLHVQGGGDSGVGQCLPVLHYGVISLRTFLDDLFIVTTVGGKYYIAAIIGLTLLHLKYNKVDIQESQSIAYLLRQAEH